MSDAYLCGFILFLVGSNLWAHIRITRLDYKSKRFNEILNGNTTAYLTLKNNVEMFLNAALDSISDIEKRTRR